MLSAYRRELGKAFPSADPKSVLLVLQECNKPGKTSQKQIEQATGVTQSNVAKLMAKMIDRGWLEVSERDPKTSIKAVSVSLAGQVVLMDFEKACRYAVRNVAKK
jgi:DNA-binding MarR family transcriptional regulator